MNEDEMARAFSRALRDWFKKPGPWLPAMTFEAGTTFRVPKGQVWEIYGYTEVTGGFLINGGEGACGAPGRAVSGVLGIGIYVPAGGFGVWSDVAGDWIVQAFSTASQGWILSGGECIGFSDITAPFKLRMRRRFDLEER